jgi:hypothetical protein
MDNKYSIVKVVATKLYRVQHMASGEVDYFATLNDLREWIDSQKTKPKWINVK